MSGLSFELVISMSLEAGRPKRSSSLIRSLTDQHGRAEPAVQEGISGADAFLFFPSARLPRPGLARRPSKIPCKEPAVGLRRDDNSTS